RAGTQAGPEGVQKAVEADPAGRRLEAGPQPADRRPEGGHRRHDAAQPVSAGCVGRAGPAGQAQEGRAGDVRADDGVPRPRAHPSFSAPHASSTNPPPNAASTPDAWTMIATFGSGLVSSWR